VIRHPVSKDSVRDFLKLWATDRDAADEFSDIILTELLEQEQGSKIKYQPGEFLQPSDYLQGMGIRLRETPAFSGRVALLPHNGRCIGSAIAFHKLGAEDQTAWVRRRRNEGNEALLESCTEPLLSTSELDMERSREEIKMALDALEPYVAFLRRESRSGEADKLLAGHNHKEGPKIMQEIGESCDVCIVVFHFVHCNEAHAPLQAKEVYNAKGTLVVPLLLQLAIDGAGHGSEHYDTFIHLARCQSRGRMFDVLQASRDIEQIAIESISREGYAVIEAAFESSICDDTLGDIWAWLEEVTTGRVKRRDPNSWEKWWPATTRGRFFKGFCSWKATQRARRQVHRWATGRIFNQTGGPYVISTDGFTFELPHSKGKKFTKPQAWWHVDQTPTAGVRDEGLKYLQMSVALNNNVDNGSCFACFPRSHSHFRDLCIRNPEMAGDFYALKPDDVTALKTAGCTEKRVYVKQGDVIVWDSRLVHMGAGATQADAKTVPSSDSWPACGPRVLGQRAKSPMGSRIYGHCIQSPRVILSGGVEPILQGSYCLGLLMRSTIIHCPIPICASAAVVTCTVHTWFNSDLRTCSSR
jgi:hypothetical protein